MESGDILLGIFALAFLCFLSPVLFIIAIIWAFYYANTEQFLSSTVFYNNGYRAGKTGLSRRCHETFGLARKAWFLGYDKGRKEFDHAI